MLKILIKRKVTVVIMVSSATVLAMIYLNVYSLVGGIYINSSSSSNNNNNIGYSSLCNTSVVKEHLTELNKDLPIIYFITPTFSRAEQIAEMTRLGQTLLHVPNLVWIVAEDSVHCSKLVGRALGRWSKIQTDKSKTIEGRQRPYVHLISPMPTKYKYSANKPRGVSNRNAGLKWIRENHCRGPLRNSEKTCGGVVYFGDDDNTYDLRLFEEIRHTNTVSMFPVGLVGRQGISSPLVKDGKVIGFTDPWFHHRKFPIDMAGFAFNVRLLLETHAKMPFTVGMEEDLFIKALGVKYDDIEPLADGCTKVLVWHTQTLRRKKVRSFRPSHLAGSNLKGLMGTLRDMGVLNIDDSAREALPMCLQERCH